MVSLGSGFIQLFAAAFVIASGYAFGRIHQWYKGGAARDLAYRSGFDRASNRMFDLEGHSKRISRPWM